MFYNFEHEQCCFAITCKNVIYSFDISKCSIKCLVSKYSNFTWYITTIHSGDKVKKRRKLYYVRLFIIQYLNRIIFTHVNKPGIATAHVGPSKKSAHLQK